VINFICNTSGESFWSYIVLHGLVTAFVTQAVLDTVHVTVFDQSYVISARAMADTFFIVNGEYVVVSRPISALIMRIKRTFSRSC